MSKLIVRVIGCRNLPRTDAGGLGKIDPYVRVRLAGQMYRTRTVSDCQNPVYNETFEFIDPPGTDAVIFELYDDDVTSEKFIGKVSLSSDHLPQGVTRLGWPNNYSMRSGGELEVEVYRTGGQYGGYGGGYAAPPVIYGSSQPVYSTPQPVYSSQPVYSTPQPSYGTAPQYPPQQYPPQYPPQQYAPPPQQYAPPPQQYAPPPQQYAPPPQQYAPPPQQYGPPPQQYAPPPQQYSQQPYAQAVYSAPPPVVYASPPSGYSAYGGYSG